MGSIFFFGFIFCPSGRRRLDSQIGARAERAHRPPAQRHWPRQHRADRPRVHRARAFGGPPRWRIFSTVRGLTVKTIQAIWQMPENEVSLNKTLAALRWIALLNYRPEVAKVVKQNLQYIDTKAMITELRRPRNDQGGLDRVPSQSASHGGGKRLVGLDQLDSPQGQPPQGQPSHDPSPP